MTTIKMEGRKVDLANSHGSAKNGTKGSSPLPWDGL